VNEVIALSKGGPVAVDLYSAFRSMSLDVIYDYVFGEDSGAPSSIPLIPLVNHNSGIQRHISIILGRLGSLPESIRPRIALSILPRPLMFLGIPYDRISWAQDQRPTKRRERNKSGSDCRAGNPTLPFVAGRVADTDICGLGHGCKHLFYGMFLCL
jgi:hypothetical protein